MLAKSLQLFYDWTEAIEPGRHAATGRLQDNPIPTYTQDTIRGFRTHFHRVDVPDETGRDRSIP